jgi:hypothetical protein
MLENKNNGIKSKWWSKTIRERNYFGFRYWWFNWAILLLAIGLFTYFLYTYRTEVSACTQQTEINELIKNINAQLDSCCSCHNEEVPPPPPPIEAPPPPETPPPPTPPVTPPPKEDTRPKGPSENCRVHFSGGLMGGEYDPVGISKIYVVDEVSEYVGSGEYPSNEAAFPKAVAQTFDGIAIDRGTRLILYSQPNFTGTVLLDIKGPAIINNVIFKDDPRYSHCNTENYSSELQRNYPQSVRKWSRSDMTEWSHGSCKITCD